jgi:hypothetical protein
MYELINQKEADRIFKIFKDASLLKPINVVIGDYELKASDKGEIVDTQSFKDYDMDEFSLLNNGSYETFKRRKNKYDAFVSYGEWGYKTRLNKTHITLGTGYHNHCFQLELSQALTDNKFYYIVKNVSDKGGEGSIKRLYKGIKNDRLEMDKRQSQFISEFPGDLLRFQNKDWITISKIKHDELFDDSKKDDNLYHLVYNMFYALILVESISGS